MPASASVRILSATSPSPDHPTAAMVARAPVTRRTAAAMRWFAACSPRTSVRVARDYDRRGREPAVGVSRVPRRQPCVRFPDIGRGERADASVIEQILNVLPHGEAEQQQEDEVGDAEPGEIAGSSAAASLPATTGYSL